MGVRVAIEVNSNDEFGPEVKIYFAQCGGIQLLRLIRRNLKTADTAAGVLKKLGNYTKKGTIRPWGRTKLTPGNCWPFIEYILRVNLIDDSSFELEAIYETISSREFAHVNNRSKSFVK